MTCPIQFDYDWETDKFLMRLPDGKAKEYKWEEFRALTQGYAQMHLMCVQFYEFVCCELARRDYEKREEGATMKAEAERLMEMLNHEVRQ